MLPFFLDIKMLKQDSTYQDLVNILRASGELDFNVITATVTDQISFEQFLKAKITFMDDRESIILTFKEPTYYNKPENSQLLSGQDELISRVNEIFVKNTKVPTQTDWDLRKIKFVLGEINTWSKDPSTKVSAAIFNGKYPICSSYNGFPPGVEDTEERLNNRPLKYKIVQHAEANAISTCARLGIKTEGMSMAVSLFPCTACAGMIIAAGIKEVITVEPSEDAKSRWGEDFELSKTLFSEAGVKVTIVNLDNQ